MVSGQTPTSVSRRLAYIIGSALFGILALVVANVFSERQLIMDERKASVRQNVEVAHGVLQHFHALAQAGKLSDADARQQAAATLQALRYSGSEYFWINDMQPRMVMHAIKPELNGKDLSENKDPTGKRLFVAFVDVVKNQGSGFVDYLWPKPGSDNPVPKLSYVKGFQPWGWVVGSGVYVDNVESSVFQRAAVFAAAAGLLAAALGVFGWFTTRALMAQLGGEPHQAMSATRQLAAGNLAVDIPVRPGDTGSLLHAIATLRDNFAGIVAQVRQASTSVATASAEIAQGNLDLSQRTEQQAAALEQSAASMEELGSTVKQNAANARHANDLASTAAQVASRGGDAVNHVVSTMRGINDSSRKIADIIGVIDGIAFQTNILALNAAVEAARAGEQGRGFAVVASEVRSLASRSAEAAKQIKALIGDSVGRVQEGTAQVDAAGETMAKVVTHIQEVAALMGQITTASAEQSDGVAQVGEAVTQMDRNTQQNAALVEEGAAAAENLRRQADQLVQVVASFQLR